MEGGKPQLLFYAKAFIEKKAVEERFYDKIEKVKGKSKYNTETNKKVMKTDGNKLYWILRERIFDYRINIDYIESNEVKLPMMPSSIASFVMLRNYIAQVA